MPMIRKTVSCDDSRIVSEEKTLNGRHVHETEVVSPTNFQFLWMTA